MDRFDPVAARDYLRDTDPVLAPVIDAVGLPAIREDRADPFWALSRAIVYQQLSGKAARTIFTRYLALFGHDPDCGGVPDPAEVLAVDDETLRAAGLSRQKIASIRDLAVHVADGLFDEATLRSLDNEAIIERLTVVRGIGRWTAEMYLMFSLGRPDVLPVNDLGINKAIRDLYGLDDLPSPAVVREIGARWQPWASAACWYLWRSHDIVLMGDPEAGASEAASG
jgi:3-methyladenine DNA glycosylase/8-oxoguanine DNA glycosylase